jgi:hypothetical protein
MPYSKVPSAWLGAGYTLSSNKVQFNTSTAGSNPLVLELTDAQANATTGDIAQIFYGLSSMMHKAYAAKADADRPANMTLNKSTQSVSETQILHSFTLSFTVSSNVVYDVEEG